MMRVAVIAGLVLLASASPATAADGRKIMRCSQQSGAGFPGAYADQGNLVVGPFAWLGARRNNFDGAYEGGYRWKQPVLVRPGHTATLRIGAAARGFARLTYTAVGWSFSRAVRTVTFKSCPAAQAKSTTDGRPVTFWSGGIVLTRPSACVPVEIRIDGGPIRRRAVPIGPGASCR